MVDTLVAEEEEEEEKEMKEEVDRAEVAASTMSCRHEFVSKKGGGSWRFQTSTQQTN